MTATPDSQDRQQIQTRRQSNTRKLPTALPFKLPVMGDHTADVAIDMSDMLLLSWILLTRRHSVEDDVHFAWSYGKASEGLLSRRKVTVEKRNIVLDILRDIQILRKQALIPEEIERDPEGNYLVINNSSGTINSGASVGTPVKT